MRRCVACRGTWVFARVDRAYRPDAVDTPLANANLCAGTLSFGETIGEIGVGTCVGRGVVPVSTNDDVLLATVFPLVDVIAFQPPILVAAKEDSGMPTFLCSLVILLALLYQRLLRPLVLTIQ